MNHPRMSCLAAAMLALAACHGQPTGNGPVSAAATGSAAAPGATQAGIALTAGRLVLPAVPGNPAAAYFILVNNGTKGAVLTGVAIAGAQKAEMHETTGTGMEALPSVTVPGGGSVSFAPGGKHVMVFGLAPTLAPGASVRIALTFADGAKTSGTLSLQPAGGGDAMAGMKM